MRNTRDYHTEMKALEERKRVLKARRIEQLGNLVSATGADVLDTETLVGALLDAVAAKDAMTKEAWRAKGDAFFQRRRRKTGAAAPDLGESAEAQPDGDPADPERPATLI